MERTKPTLVLIFMLFLLPRLFCESGAKYVDLDEIIEATGTRFQWEPYRTIGVLEKAGKQVVFRPDFPFLILDYGVKVPVSLIKYLNGKLLFPEESARTIIAVFNKELPIPEKPEPQTADPPSYRVSVILIDPGHGGKDPGTIGTHTFQGKEVQIKEKDVVLDVSLKLDSMLKKKYPDKKVILTRSGDTYPSLEERTEIANGIALKDHEAIIFISLHVNASLNKKAKGLEVWYLPPYVRRNVLDPVYKKTVGEDVASILNSMREEEFTFESVKLADLIMEGMLEKVGDLTKSRGKKEESWFVVKNAKMPSVLIELGFITNQDEARLLIDQSYLKKLTQGIYNGIENFVTYFENSNGFTE